MGRSMSTEIRRALPSAGALEEEPRAAATAPVRDNAATKADIGGFRVEIPALRADRYRPLWLVAVGIAAATVVPVKPIP